MAAVSAAGGPAHRAGKARGKGDEGVSMRRLRQGGRAAWTLLAGTALLALGLWATAQDAGTKKSPGPAAGEKKAEPGAKKAEPAKGAEAPAKSKFTEKLYTLEFRAKPWSSVFEWLVDKTGLPMVSTHVPTGTFSFIAPAGRKYSMPEIIDIVNEGLLAHKYVLLRRPSSFVVVPADEKIDPALIPLIHLNELPERGDTEIVRVAVPLKRLLA